MWYKSGSVLKKTASIQWHILADFGNGKHLLSGPFLAYGKIPKGFSAKYDKYVNNNQLGRNYTCHLSYRPKLRLDFTIFTRPTPVSCKFTRYYNITKYQIVKKCQNY